MSSWYASHTSAATDWPLALVESLKGDRRIAVVIPARNEQATVGGVVTMIRTELGDLIDELIVMDSLSSDATAEEASRAGAAVHSVADVRPELGVEPGKGEALWKSLFVTEADILVFIDADLSEWGTHFITGLLGPLLSSPTVQLVRGFYDRVVDDGVAHSIEGGRVTELVARPWIALHRPELIDVVQPLAGEWAIRRATFAGMSVPVGYGIELSTLLDVHRDFGLDAIAQVDLGRRAHTHQSLYDLGAMATEILAVADRRISETGDVPDSVLLRRMAPDRSMIDRQVNVTERPRADRIA